jgi:hypothetical protein
MPVRAVIERGPNGKKSVSFGLDWPGWSRGAKDPELALEMLESYRERYRPVALPFLIRHSAYHTLDHAWEMEDKDLSAADGA